MKNWSTSLIIKEMQIKTMLINLLTPESSGENVKKRKQEILLHCWYKVNWYSIYEKNNAVLKKKKKKKTRPNIWSSNYTSRYISEGIKFWSPKDICISKSTVALFAIAKTWKQPCVHRCLWIINCEIYM